MAAELERGVPGFIRAVETVCHFWGRYRALVIAFFTLVIPTYAASVITAVDLLATVCPALIAGNPVTA